MKKIHFTDSTTKPGSQTAMRGFIQQVRKLNSIPRQSALDPNKSIKELYHDSIDNDPLDI